METGPLVNKEFYNYILPSKKVIKYSPRVKYPTNNVIFRNIVLYGYQGSGKTSSVRRIVYEAVKKYGQGNVNARMSEDGDLGALLRWGLRPVLVNILFSDNTTLRKIPREELMRYFRIRHIYRERFGLDNGYILSLIALHRFHSIPPELRTTIDGLLIKDSSMNPYDRSVLKRFIGEDNLRLLETLSIEREKYPDLKSIGIFVGRTFSGLVSLPLPRKDFLRPVYSTEEIVMDLKRILNI